MSKRYDIEHVGDLLDLPADALERALKELPDALMSVKVVFDIAKMCGDPAKGRTIMPKFTYIDDDKGEVTINVTAREEA